MPSSKYYHSEKYIQKRNQSKDEYNQQMREYYQDKYYDCSICQKKIKLSSKSRHNASQKHLINSGTLTKPDKVQCIICNVDVYDKNLEKHRQTDYHKKNLDSKYVEFILDSDIDE